MHICSRNVLSDRVNFSIKLFVFLFCIHSCYQYCSVLVIYLIVVALFGHGIPVALPVFHYSESVPLFHRCSVFSSSVFRCSWFYSIPEQKETAQKESPRSVCKWSFLKIWDFLKILRYAKKLDYFKIFFSLFFKVSIRQNF